MAPKKLLHVYSIQSSLSRFPATIYHSSCLFYIINQIIIKCKSKEYLNIWPFNLLGNVSKHLWQASASWLMVAMEPTSNPASVIVISCSSSMVWLGSKTNGWLKPANFFWIPVKRAHFIVFNIDSVLMHCKLRASKLYRSVAYGIANFKIMNVWYYVELLLL